MAKEGHLAAYLALPINHDTSKEVVTTNQFQQAFVVNLAKDSRHEHIVADRIKEFTQINVKRLVQPLRDVAFNLLHGILRRLSQSQTKLLAENSGARIGDNTCTMACCITLSITVGIPSSRAPPSGFSITARRTGDGLYVPSNKAWRT